MSNLIAKISVSGNCSYVNQGASHQFVIIDQLLLAIKETSGEYLSLVWFSRERR